MTHYNPDTRQNISLHATPSSTTLAANASVLTQLPFEQQDDFDQATRGFVGTIADQAIVNAQGQVVWDLAPYDFLSTQSAPPTVHPSLWRQARLNYIHGLFKVTDRIYQVRGLDLSNMTIIEGDTGLIIIDPLTSLETAHASLQLYYAHFAPRPVRAVIYTHSHTDHYGGVKGVVSEDDVEAGKVQILAPADFMAHAVSENVFAGNAMSRRAMYMYGALLPKSELGQVDAGLGKTIPLGTITLIPPTDTIRQSGEWRTIDGVEMEFLMAMNTEAPSEMLIFFPQFQALCAAEDMTHTLHNLYTLRGAEVRDPVSWWKTINETIERFGSRTEVVFAQHHWPTWGQAQILTFLKKQRDLYKYLHDQTLRLINHGYTMLEVAEKIQLPAELAQCWYNRGYYGSVNHNVKGIYQKYLGFYSSNPADLHPLPPEEAARKYVEYMGGPEQIMQKARRSFDAGEYRWVAQVMHHVVFADPTLQPARELLAATFEQLAYQCENPTWRNEYLMGALELRQGHAITSSTKTDSPDVIKAMTIDMLLDYLGIRLNGPKANGKSIALNLSFSDTNQRYAIQLENSALTYTPDKQFARPDATLTLSRAILDAINLGATTFENEIAFNAIQIQGDKNKVLELLSLMDTFEPTFNVVTP
ncbi:alkyl/aryl-sulfatase [Dictyobacter aurantiacus]|uniref:Linear primary-alkylsulfatase n=1 Tax=Dictyobacter aurantiacus TaxID=1936993 RepID=A0A401ZL78_9CHLR|nr:alkyl sulfatase dimerization domain-containing protein [Dictyobacter aurantiacus]GCE07641.1 alkyl sulfatase [Dictyobacter aurantiacus]